MKVGIWLAVALAVSSPAWAWAEDVKISADMTVTPAQGWQQGPAPAGADAQFKLPGDERSRIEFRSVPLESAEQADRFFRSYHANLVSMGLKVTSQARPVTYGSRAGVETVYGGKSKDGDFSLVLFQFTHNKRAWILVGFATAKRQEVVRTALGEFAKGLKAK